MIYLFLGKDAFNKRQAVRQLQAGIPGAELVTLDAPETEKDILREVSGASLFSSKKVIVVKSALSKLNAAALIDAIASSTDEIIFDEDSLDKRKKETKALLADTRIIVREFTMPTGAVFDAWILAKSKEYGFTFAPQAARHFAERLGDDGRNELDYDLFQADNELQKLAAYANGGSISTSDIDALIAESYNEDIFIVTNAIADRKQSQAMKAIENFLDRVPGADEKSKIINLSAILAEQLRGMYAFGTLIARGAGDVEIAEATGFTPGRIFVYRKLSKSFSTPALRDALRKFEALDAEVKTSSGPAGLQFYMIIQGLMK
jgi:DNA polymerase III delta subunit